MKSLSELRDFARSGLPGRDDDAAFRHDLSFIDSLTELLAFVERFQLARTTVADWQAGRCVPHSSARGRYSVWLRERARERVAQAAPIAPAAPVAAARQARG